MGDTVKLRKEGSTRYFFVSFMSYKIKIGREVILSAKQTVSTPILSLRPRLKERC